MDTKETYISMGVSGALEGSTETLTDRCFSVHVFWSEFKCLAEQ